MSSFILPAEKKAGARRPNQKKHEWKPVFNLVHTYHPHSVQNAQELYQEFVHLHDTRSQALINVQSDGSRRSRNTELGGVANICDISLPNGDRYTVQEAEPIDCYDNSFIPEAADVLKSCQIAKDALKNANLASDIAITINIVTDCLSILDILDKFDYGTLDKAKRYEPLIRAIDTLTGVLKAGSPSVRLNLFYCPRNQTVKMKLADRLAGRAATTQKSYKRKIIYDRFGKCSARRITISSAVTSRRFCALSRQS